jgi:hypothetical protein
LLCLSICLQSLIAIQPRAPTQKQLRGGSAKWALKHLPSGTSSQFTDEVVPLARELAGSQQLEPWTKLTVKQVQDIIDKVYGKGEYMVEASGPWMGLVRLQFPSPHSPNDNTPETDRLPPERLAKFDRGSTSQGRSGSY